jgi:hypothetical protein
VVTVLRVFSDKSLSHTEELLYTTTRIHLHSSLVSCAIVLPNRFTTCLKCHQRTIQLVWWRVWTSCKTSFQSWVEEYRVDAQEPLRGSKKIKEETANFGRCSGSYWNGLPTCTLVEPVWKLCEKHWCRVRIWNHHRMLPNHLPLVWTPLMVVEVLGWYGSTVLLRTSGRTMLTEGLISLVASLLDILRSV